MAKQPKPKACRSWVVTVKATVLKEIVCEDCTEREAREDYYDHAVQEREVDTSDSEVEKVEPNE